MNYTEQPEERAEHLFERVLPEVTPFTDSQRGVYLECVAAPDSVMYNIPVCLELPPYGCGELIICGECVGRGYVGLPEKTAASFFRLRGRPAYHSGDVVRVNTEGEVEFFGRSDNQVKLRGYRVELDEIEKSICSFEGVRQSKVIVRNNGSEDYLTAFFTAERKIDIPALTAYLKASLK